jgi:hypothetical protein
MPLPESSENKSVSFQLTEKLALAISYSHAIDSAGFLLRRQALLAEQPAGE